jgi:hypothetical protein
MGEKRPPLEYRRERTRERRRISALRAYVEVFGAIALLLILIYVLARLFTPI